MWRRRIDAELDLDLVLAEPALVDDVMAVTEANRAHIAAWESWASEPADRPSTEAWLRSCLEGYLAGTLLQAYLYVGDEMVGSAGLRFDADRSVAELGYWLATSAAGRGYATRAGIALIGIAFDEREVRRVELRTSVDNAPSRALAERLGFRLEGVARAAYPVAGRVDDVALYGLLPGERP